MQVHPTEKHARFLGPIILGCDEAFAMPMATTLRSIVEANRPHWPLDFHVLSDGLCEATKDKIAASLPPGAATIRWIVVNLEMFESCRLHPALSKMTFARFLIPELFSNDVARVLYLDADLLVLNDLEPLWRTDLEGAVIAAVLDRWDHRMKKGDLEFASVPRVQNYFNAGVLLIDLARWRGERVSEKAIDYLNLHPKAHFLDQDALNVICDGLWKRLDPRWNFHDVAYVDVSEIAPERRPGIVHFVGSKPWNTDRLHPSAEFYDAYRRRTRYARTLREKLEAWPRLAWMRAKAALKRSFLARSIRKAIGQPKDVSAT